MELRFPAFMYGAYDEVRRAAGRAVTQVLRANSLQPIWDGTYLDVAPLGGVIVLDRRWSSISASEPNVHADVFWKILESRLEKGADGASKFKSFVESGLSEAWCFVGVVDSSRYFLVRRASEQLRFLGHARAHWPALLGAGTRYSTGNYYGEDLAQLTTLVSYCLARQGAPQKALHPLTSARLDELMSELPGAKVQQSIHDGRLDEAAAEVRRHEEVVLLSLAEHFVEAGLDDLACSIVESVNSPDPYGVVVREWLAGRGNPNRWVR
jgi:hypothetical protein